MTTSFLEKIMPILQALRHYHRHEVVGMRHIPQEGPALLVVNHSLATYDIMLLIAAIHESKGRSVRALADKLFFKIPGLGAIVEGFGGVKGTPDNAEPLLASGEIVCVAPGGMREALRPSSEKYAVDWDGRFGFAKLALRCGAPVVLAACPRADDLFFIYPSPITKWVYKRFRIPLPLARLEGILPGPKPVKLVHFLSEPIQPPPLEKDARARRRQVAAFHDLLESRMKVLMKRGKVASRLP